MGVGIGRIGSWTQRNQDPDAQVPNITWHRTVLVSPLHLRIPRALKIPFHPRFVESVDANLGIWRVDCVFIEKNPHVSGAVLFKGQLYSHSAPSGSSGEQKFYSTQDL